MKDKKTGKSRGFGYITMKNSLSIDVILKSQPFCIEGKLVECKIAIPKDHINESVNPLNGISNNNTKSNVTLFNHGDLNIFSEIK